MAPDLRHGVDLAIGDPGLLQPLRHLGRSEALEGLHDQRRQQLPLGAAQRVGGETCIPRECGLQQHLVAEDLPFPLVLQAQHDHLAVTGAKGAVRVDRGVAGPRAGRRIGTVEGVVQREPHPFGQGFQHRDVDALPLPGLLAVHQGGEDVGVGIHACGDVGHGWPGLARHLGGAGHRHQAGLALDQQVVGLLVAVGPVGTVTGDVAHDQSGLARRQGLVGHAQPCGSTWRQVLHQYIRLPDHQLLQDAVGGLLLDIQREALLRAVGPDEVGGQAPHPPVVGPREVACAGPLDLDDARAQVGELARGERRRDRVFEGDDGDALEWLHGMWLRRWWLWRPWSGSPHGRDPTAGWTGHRPTAVRAPRTDGCRRSAARP